MDGGAGGNVVVNPKIFDSMRNYDVIDVPEPDDCQHCTSCLRMRLMEMGFVPGQHLSIEPKRLGLHIVHMVAANGRVEQTIVLRSDELGKICLKETI